MKLNCLRFYNGNGENMRKYERSIHTRIQKRGINSMRQWKDKYTEIQKQGIHEEMEK